MDELVKIVSKKTGLSDALAKTAVNLVLDYIRKKLPTTVSAQIDLFLRNEAKVTATASMVGNILGASKKTGAKKPAVKKTAKK